MAISVKIDPVERVTTASIRADLSLPEQRKAAAEFARQGIEEAKQINRSVLGRVPPYITTVDGRQGAALESVNPDGGQIITEFELVGDVLVWIASELEARSPVASGRYRRGHTLFADGREIPRGAAVPPASEYIYLNREPYARKIEIGKTESGRAFVIQVPNRIYERTAKDARSRFGNIADIQFAYREMASAYMLRRSSGRRRDRRAGATVSSPAIIVRLRKT